MGLFGWIFYIIMGIIFFIFLLFLQNKYQISKLEKFAFSHLLFYVLAGICCRFHIPYMDNLFLVFVFLLIMDIIYTSYYVERDFFNKTENQIFYYSLLILSGFVVNQEFFNRVQEVFLTGDDYRILLWGLMLFFLYSFFRNKNVFISKEERTTSFLSQETILVRYAKLKYKYHDDCMFDDKELVNLLYAIMIFQDHRRGKVLRDYDTFLFRLNGAKRKLGIMQVESSRFISDHESIALTYKKLEKFYHKEEKTNKKKKKVTIEEVIQNYDRENAQYIQYIFDIIQKY